jgi:hypothetical protein
MDMITISQILRGKIAGRRNTIDRKRLPKRTDHLNPSRKTNFPSGRANKITNTLSITIDRINTLRPYTNPFSSKPKRKIYKGLNKPPRENAKVRRRLLA